MHKFKSAVIMTLFFLSVTLPAYAENWIEVNNNNKVVMLDTDSVWYNFKNKSLYYNVKYYSKKAKDFLVVTIQSADDLAGEVSTCKYSDYIKNNSLANTKTDNISKSMKPMTNSSMIYYANLFANYQFKSGKTSQKPPEVIPAKKNENITEQVPKQKEEIKPVSVSKETTPSMETKIRPRVKAPVHNPEWENMDSPRIVAIEEPDFGPFMKDLRRRIKLNWNPPKGSASRSVILDLKVAKDGSLISCDLEQSSGVREIDLSAKRAVYSAAPFMPLPAAFKNSSIDIQYSFDYNVLGENKNKNKN